MTPSVVAITAMETLAPPAPFHAYPKIRST
jgi:hypothetical protein